MAWPLTATAAAQVPSGSTARRDRTTRSYRTGRHLQPKLVELSAGSDGLYSQPIQPA
jgi:hypothetical protein